MNRRKAEWKHIERKRKDFGHWKSRSGSRYGMREQEKGTAKWKHKLNKLLQWDTEWRVMDVSEEACADAKRLLEAIFREED